MQCDNAIELMHRHVDGDLSEQESLELDAHLNGCPSCMLAFARLKALTDELALLPQVTPPFSIVDSIMPRLLEIDKQSQKREESAAFAVDSDSNPPASHSRRKLSSLFSWRIAGAVAVAACAAILFILNNKGDILEPLKQASTLNDSRVMTEQATANTLAPDAPITSPVNGTADKSAPAANTAKPDTAQKMIVPSASPVPTGETGKSPEVSVSETRRNETPVSTDKMKESGDRSASAEPSSPPAAEGDTAVNANSLVAPSETPVEDPQSPDPVYEDNKELSLALGGSVTDSQKSIFSNSNQDIRVANDSFVAEVKDRRLTISALSSNQVIFTSFRQWQDSELITPIAWTPEGKFYYEVSGNGTVRAFLIDPKLRTERQIK